MQQITEWLARLGLGQYAQVFDDDGIDFSVLPDLTDQDRENLGFCSGIAASCYARLPTSKAPAATHLRAG